MAAYRDAVQPIGQGQTISQPTVVAMMAQALELTSDCLVLEIGAGSGYAAAVASRLARHVCTIERHAELAKRCADQAAGVQRLHRHRKLASGSLSSEDLGAVMFVPMVHGGDRAV